MSHHAAAHLSHDHPPSSPRATRIVIGVLAAAVVAVLAGLALMWPPSITPTEQFGTTTHGTVEKTQRACDPAGANCVIEVDVLITDGPDEGQSTKLTFVPGATDPGLSADEDIRMSRSGSGPQAVYVFADIERSGPMLLLAALFLVVVLLVGRLRGLAAMLGLGVAGGVLVLFMIPALVAGQSGLLVALIGGGVIAVAVLPLSHGLSVSTGAALIGTLVGMGLSAALAAATISALHFTGTSGEEAAVLSYLGSRSTVPGLLLCASVIGAIGVLNDATVTQAVAAFEIAAADPTLSARSVFASAMRIGRDHIASTVYSLVLAYAGSALPVLLLFAITAQPIGDVLTSDQLGPDVAAGLIGSTALVLVVPLTTLIAAVLATVKSTPVVAEPLPAGEPAVDQ